MAPARQLAGVLTIGQQARAGVERIFQLLDLPPAIADAAGRDRPARAARRDHLLERALPLRRRCVRCFSGFDLHIAPGERVAIVGPSGSGKSTLAMLVSRFYDPTAGTVSVDGHDVRDVTLHSLRRQVGVVFEESFLFSDSVRANIAYGRPDATDEQIEAAARAAQAHEFIERAAARLRHRRRRAGTELSGGQRQRIALARAILYDPRILILDDATSAIDARTEDAIHDALRAVMADRTTLLIAHRRRRCISPTGSSCSTDGRVVESGHPRRSSSRAARSTARCCPASTRSSTPRRSVTRSRRLRPSRPRPERTVPPRRRGRVTGSVRAAGPQHGRPAHRIGAPSIGPGLGGGGRRLAAQPRADARAARARGAAPPGARRGEGRPGARVAPRPALHAVAAAPRVPPAVAARARARGHRRRSRRLPARCW